MKTYFVFLLLVLCLTSCTYKMDVPTEFPTPPPPPVATPLPKLALKPDRELERQISEIAQTAKGNVGVAAVLIETGDAALYNGDAPLPMQSVYKLPISMAVLYADTMDRLSLDEKVAITPEDFVRRGVRSPLRDQFPQGGEFTIRELIGMSMTESDGTASDVLMEQAGGPTEVQSYLTQLGIRDMKVANSEKEIFRDWDTQYKSSATPLATIELLRALHEGGGISPEDRKVLLYFMENSDPGGRRLKKLLPEATPIAHKTGTGGNRDGVNSATNDIGIVELPDGRHLAIAVYISDSSADMATREKAIADIAKAAWDRWAK